MQSSWAIFLPTLCEGMFAGVLQLQAGWDDVRDRSKRDVNPRCLHQISVFSLMAVKLPLAHPATPHETPDYPVQGIGRHAGKGQSAALDHISSFQANSGFVLNGKVRVRHSLPAVCLFCINIAPHEQPTSTKLIPLATRHSPDTLPPAHGDLTHRSADWAATPPIFSLLHHIRFIHQQPPSSSPKLYRSTLVDRDYRLRCPATLSPKYWKALTFSPTCSGHLLHVSFAQHYQQAIHIRQAAFICSIVQRPV